MDANIGTALASQRLATAVDDIVCERDFELWVLAMLAVQCAAVVEHLRGSVAKCQAISQQARWAPEKGDL